MEDFLFVLAEREIVRQLDLVFANSVFYLIVLFIQLDTAEFLPGNVNTVADTLDLGSTNLDRNKMRFTSTGTLPLPLVAGTDYWLRSQGGTLYTAHLNLNDANGNVNQVDLTTTGGGTHTYIEQPLDNNSAIQQVVKHEVNPGTYPNYTRTLFNPGAASFDPVDDRAETPEQGLSLPGGTLSIPFNGEALLQGSTATPGDDTQGDLAGINVRGADQGISVAGATWATQGTLQDVA